jgi:hypothetical protein
MLSNTTTSITLNAIPDCEYRMDGGDWQTSTEFTGLTPDTGYEFEAYIPATATHLASQVSEKATIRTDAVGIDELILSKVSIYPNPTQGLVNITVSQPSNVIIYDVTGKLIATYMIHDNATIELKQPVGVYFIKVASSAGISTHRLVIIK